MSADTFGSYISGSAGLDRRRLLQAGSAVAAAGMLPAPVAHASAPVFGHGIASGDPLPDGVVLWTRVTVSPKAVPGSGIGEPAEVRWEVAGDERFTEILATGSLTATARDDHTVKVDVRGLAPAREYYYRFTALGEVSAVGRTRTAPGPHTTPSALRFGVVSCANWENGYFAAYRHLADRDDLDAVLHLGDYLYEYAAGSRTGRDIVRAHEPAHELVSLTDYRIRHAQYKTDSDLQALHARVPFIATWDDHETANNAWSGGAENHDPATEGSWSERRAASVRAYLEWMPVRAEGTAAAPRIYRRLRFGTLAELSMLDLRSYRDEQPHVGSRDGDDPARTLTGAAQLAWLTDGLFSSSTRWQLVGNSVMISPLLFPPLDPATTAAVTGVLGVPREGVAANTDQWDGYPADRRRLLTGLAARDIMNVVFLTGDIHSSWAADVPVAAADYPAGRTAGAEFVVPSVTSAGIGDLLPGPPRTVTPSLEGAIKQLNRHIRYVDLDAHGFGVLDVSADLVRMEWFHIADITDPRTGVARGASWVLPHSDRIRPA